MASVIKVGAKWRAQVRRKGFPTETKSFGSKAAANAWAAGIESNMVALKHQDTRLIAKLTVGDLIDRYFEEVGPLRKIGRSKTAVLNSLKVALGDVLLPDLSIEVLMNYIRTRQENAGGVTIGIDLSYIGTLLKTAKNLWRLPVDPSVATTARANMQYLGLNPKSNERSRRPTAVEIGNLVTHLRTKTRQKIPMWDIIPFAIETAMRAGEIVRLRWEDLNEEDRTITIRDRKHPTEKEGNDQVVPLLGEAFELVKRQPRKGDLIFPVKEKSLSTAFTRAVKDVKISDLHFHDLRHEGVSRLFEQGYQMEQVMLVSGHRDPKMLMRYVQLKAKDLHRPVLKLVDTQPLAA